MSNIEAPKSHACNNKWPGSVIAVGQNTNLHVHCRVMFRIQKIENYIFRQVVQWKLNFSNEMIHRLSNITICNTGSGDQIPTEATSPWREVLNYKKQTSCWLEETNKRTQTMNSSPETTISKSMDEQGWVWNGRGSQMHLENGSASHHGFIRFFSSV